jgi:RNA polymerase sigma-70 factor (ECF subfamily)
MTLSRVEMSLTVRHLARDEESELLERLARGDASAVGEAYDRHHESVRAFARRFLGDEAAAEDLVHDVFVTLPRAVQGFRGGSLLRTFLISIAVNHARHHLRAAARRRNAMARLAREPVHDGGTPEQEVRRAELARALTRCLDELSLEHRVAFVLCDVEERSSREVAVITGAPEGTVRTRLHHARKKLRALLEKEGIR